ncbi:MAG: hypothetical protein AAB706_00760 [Patescibacteria group bacterium]
MAKVYVAGEDLSRADRVIKNLRKDGHTITYDWVVSINEGPSREKAKAELEGVRKADVFVHLWEHDQESARYEAGMAMGLAKPIIVSGKTDAFFFQLPNVFCVVSDDEIVEAVNKYLEK